MPCEGPSDRECQNADSRKARARAYNYLRKSLGLTPDKDSVEAELNPWSNYFEAQVPMCGLLREMSKEEIDRIVYDARSKDARRLADFWEKHQEEDRARERREKAARKVEEMARSAVKKLTPEELRALLIGYEGDIEEQEKQSG